MNKKRSKRSQLLLILTGPLAFALTVCALPSDIFTFSMRCATGTLLWMICWWLFTPVDYPVVGMLPIALNAVFQMVPMQNVVSQFASSSIILVLSGMIISSAWSAAGLDKRLATMFLRCIGTSVRSQVVFWFLLSTAMSTMLTNLVVCATVTPIALAMLRYVGYGDVGNNRSSSMILMAIPWGVTVGGLATPLGSASNLVIIEYIEKISGREYYYLDWVMRFAPIMMVLVLSNILFLVLISPKGEELPGSKEYLLNVKAQLGKMNRDEVTGLTVFAAAAILSFTRDLYASILPGLVPSYAFLVCAILLFFIPSVKGGRMVEWKHASTEINWGLLYMFGGALALGGLLTGTQADIALGSIMGQLEIGGSFGVVFVILLFTLTISDLTSNGATAAMCMPVILTMANALDMNPIPLIYVGSIGVSLSYTMPTSIRAIPVGYGLKPSFMMKRGLILSAIVVPLLSLTGWLLMEFWPAFST